MGFCQGFTPYVPRLFYLSPTQIHPWRRDGFSREQTGSQFLRPDSDCDGRRSEEVLVLIGRTGHREVRVDLLSLIRLGLLVT